MSNNSNRVGEQLARGNLQQSKQGSSNAAGNDVGGRDERQGSIVFQQAFDYADAVLQQSLLQANAGLPDALSTPGASSVRLSDTNLNGDDLEQLQELHSVPNALRSSGTVLNTEKETDPGDEALEAGPDAQGEPEGQGTPRMHPMEYVQAEAAKTGQMGEPQEALGDGEGQSEQPFAEKRELTCIEEEMLDYSPTRSGPSLVAPSHGDPTRLSQSRRIEGLHGVPSALRGSIRESNQALNKSLKWPESRSRDREDAHAARQSASNMLMTPNDRLVGGIEEMNMGSPDPLNNTDRSNLHDLSHVQRTAQQQEHKPGGIQNLMRAYQKPSLQKKMTDLKMGTTPGQPPQTAPAQQNHCQQNEQQNIQLITADQSPIKRSKNDASCADDRNDEALAEVMNQFLKNENNSSQRQSLSHREAKQTGGETQNGAGLSLIEGANVSKAFHPSTSPTPQGPNPQSRRGSARQTGPQADTKLTQPKKRNKSFNQWRKTQNREKSASAMGAAPQKQEDSAGEGPATNKTELLKQMLSQPKFQLQAKRSPEPRGAPAAEAGAAEAGTNVTAQFSSNHQAPQDGEPGTAAGRTVPLSQFHIFQSVGLQDILQRESNATGQQSVPADVFYNNPAQSVIVNVESASPDAEVEHAEARAKPDSASSVLEHGRNKVHGSELALEKAQTENQRPSRDREAVNDTVPDTIFSEGDARSSMGPRAGASNMQALTLKVPSQPQAAAPDNAYFAPTGKTGAPAGIEVQSQSQIIKNFSSQVDSDHEEQTDLLNQMLGLPGDFDKGTEAHQEPLHNALSERVISNDNDHKVDQGSKRGEHRKSQGHARPKLDLQQQMYFQTTAQANAGELETGQRGQHEHGLAPTPAEAHQEDHSSHHMTRGQPNDFELQQRISDALSATKRPGRTSVNKTTHVEAKSAVSRVLSPQANAQHVQVLHNRPAATKSKNTHHHRFGSKTSLGAYHKTAKQESKFEHTTSSQIQQQKSVDNQGQRSFIQNEDGGMGARKQSAMIQSTLVGEGDQLQLNNQAKDQPGPRLHPAGDAPASATISLAAVTASVRSASKEKTQPSSQQLTRKGSAAMPSADPYRQAAQKTIMVSEQQLDKYQQEYLERLNRAKQSNLKGNLVMARAAHNQSQANLRSSGARTRNARSPATPSTHQASQMEKAVNARRKQLASPTNQGTSSLHQARLSESVLHNSRVETGTGGHSQSTVIGQQKQQKMQIEWRQICKMFDSIPQGASMKSRYSFSRNDIISIVSQFRRKIEDLEALVQYEQQKNATQDRDYNGLLEELKEVKIEKRHYQEQLNRIPDLEIKIEQQGQKLMDCVSFLKKCMVSNVVCLEFNKDIQTLMNKFQYGIRSTQDLHQNKDKNPIQQQMQNSRWQGVQEVVKAVSELQEQHNLFQKKEVPHQGGKTDYEQSFSVNIDLIEGFITDLIQFQQIHTVYEKVVKVDLENMSSGTDEDDDDDDADLEGHGTQRILSEDEGQQVAGDGHRNSEMNYSQHDSEICRIKIKAESMYNYNPSSTNMDNSSAQGNDHYTQLAGRSKKEIDDAASTRVKPSPMTVAPSPLLRAESSKQKRLQQSTAQSTSKRQMKSFVVANSRINHSVQKPPMLATNAGAPLASKTSKGTAPASGGDPAQAAQPPRPSTLKQGRKSRQSRLHKKAQQAPGDSRQLSSIVSVTSPCKSDSRYGSGMPQKPNRTKHLKGPVTEETIREINKETTGHYEKVMQELQSKKLQYSVLLEKYEHKAKRVMELQDEISKVADLRNEQEIRRQCQEQFGKLEQQYGQLVLKNEGLQKQIRDHQKEIYQQEQSQQNYQQQINNLNNYIKTQHQLLQDDAKIAELEKAVITLCNNQLAQKFENITSQDKQILQAVFGDGFLIQNQMRADLVRAREVAQFLLNDVAIQIFDFFEKLDRSAVQRNAATNQFVKLGNQQIQESTLPQQSLYYEKASNNDTASLAPSLKDQHQLYQTQARQGRAAKVTSPEDAGSDQVAHPSSQHRQNGQASGPVLGFVNQLNQKKGKNMEADLNFNLFNDHEGDDSPQKPANATVDEPRAARSAAKHHGHGAQHSPRENAAMTNRSNRSMNTIKSGERKSLNTRRSSQVGARGGGNLSTQAALYKRISQQNKFLDAIKSQVQIMYDRHEDFNDFIFSDEARESLLRHISVATRTPVEAGGEHSMSVAERRPRSPLGEDHSITIDASVNMSRKGAEVSAQSRGPSRRQAHESNWTSGEQRSAPHDAVVHRPRNTQMAYLGNQIESLAVEDGPADFVTERQDLDESLALPPSSSRRDRRSQQANTSQYHDESQAFVQGQRLRQWPAHQTKQPPASDFT